MVLRWSSPRLVLLLTYVQFLVQVVLGEVEGVQNRIYVHSAQGNIAIVNGAYDLVDKKYNDKFCYQKQHFTLYLCMDEHNLWNFQPGTALGTNNGLLVSSRKNGDTPLGSGPWRAWDESNKSWKATNVKVDNEPGDMAGGPRTGSQEMEGRKVVAGMLFGALVLAMLVVSMLGSTDEHVRSYTYRLICSAFTFMIALLIEQSVWDMLILQILPGPFPRGFGMSNPVSPATKIIASFVLFILSYFALDFLGWKFQFRHSRLLVLKTLGAHICAIFGIETFTHIQHELVFTIWTQFQGQLLSSSQIKHLTSFLVVVTAYLTFSLFRAASLGARFEVLRGAPKWPWPPAAPVQQAFNAVDRSCTGWGALDRTGEAAGPHWGVLVNEGEDEAAIVTIGFLLSQSILFIATGELPGLKEHYLNSHYFNYRAPGQWSAFNIFLIKALVVLLILFFLILALRATKGNGGRPGKICQRTTAMTITWMVFRGVKWNVKEYFPGASAYQMAMAAFLLTVFCLISVVVLDKVLDMILGRNGPHLWRHLTVNFSAPNEPTLPEKAMRAVNICLGLIIALSWNQNVEISVETFVQQQHFFANHMVFSESFLCLFLAATLILPWRRVILPKSEMKEDAHFKEIDHEISILNRAETFVA